MKARTRRVSVSIKLTPGKDDNLIAWLENIPVGKRQTQVKQLLKQHLQEESGQVIILADRLSRLEEDIARIRTKVDELPVYLSKWHSEKETLNITATDALGTNRDKLVSLSDDGVTRRTHRIAKADW